MSEAREQRGVKRARQACRNCRSVLPIASARRNAELVADCTWLDRRKKTRCPGERPGCSYCLRLRQDCEYDDDEPPAPSVSSYLNDSVDVVSLRNSIVSACITGNRWLMLVI